MEAAKKVVVLVFAVFFTLCSLTAIALSETGSSQFSEKNVLILNGFQYGLPVADAYTGAIVHSLMAAGMSVDHVFVEYLDLNRNDTQAHRRHVQNKLAEKSTNHQMDFIIAIDWVAAEFIVNEGKHLFEGAPLLVSYDMQPVWEGQPRPLITAAASNDAEGTVRQAFALFPDVEHVIIIKGMSDERAPFEERLITALEAMNQQVSLDDTSDLSYYEMLERIASMPRKTIAFYGSYFQDITGETFVPAAVANAVSKVANVPVFAFLDRHIMQGLVGGSVVIHEKPGQQVAQVVLDHFSGTLVLTDEPTRVYPVFYPFYDWQELKRRGGDPTILPKGTVFLNYTPTLWESHRDLLIVTGLFVLVLLFLIILLFLANKRQKWLLLSLNQSKIDLLNAYDATIRGWSYAVDLRDEETENHSQRVTDLTVHLARQFGMKEEEIVQVRRGSLLHDIGKVAIPDSILLKPGKLTDEEWTIMRKHPVHALNMLDSIEYLRPAMDIPYCHHEKWNGSGYPRGLKGEQIPLSARIFAIVDVYDALTNDRPYRKAWSRQSAMELISEQAGQHFDPQVVATFEAEIRDMAGNKPADISLESPRS